MTGRPVLLVLHAGRAAKPRGERRAAEAASVGATMRALHSIFGRDKVPEPSVALSTRWEGEPFSRGVYSHVAVGASAQDYDTMSEPCWDETLLFAGEVGDPLRPIATHFDPFRPISTHFSHMSDPVFATSQDLIQKQNKKKTVRLPPPVLVLVSHSHPMSFSTHVTLPHSSHVSHRNPPLCRPRVGSTRRPSRAPTSAACARGGASPVERSGRRSGCSRERRSASWARPRPVVGRAPPHEMELAPLREAAIGDNASVQLDRIRRSMGSRAACTCISICLLRLVRRGGVYVAHDVSVSHQYEYWNQIQIECRHTCMNYGARGVA